MNILIGADPEVFYKQGGFLTSAHGLIEGTKWAPHRVNEGAVQVDGMALEFNIDPACDEEEWVFNIASVMAQLREMVPMGELSIIPVAEFGEEYIQSQPLEAREMGCDPDFNAYTGEVNQPPNASLPFRTAAGHIHVGWTEGASGKAHTENCHKVIKLMDLHLGVPSVLIDTCSKRRELYGKAGAFRPKAYGVEYRVLSNFWLTSDSLTRWAFRATHQAMAAMNGDVNLEGIDIEHVINTSDQEQAMALVERFNLEVPSVL